ncbi:MAG: hypothetical protein JJT76_01640 [Clostridiaceae bacterium]|nr:hypothetical protein [Clostridiaceae bacterium]
MKITKKKKIALFMMLILSITLVTTACMQGNTTDETVETLTEVTEEAIASEAEGITIVASTSWTALMAEAAGAENVAVIAPVELRHPPEYDFRPSDIQIMQEADWIIMGGYEPFMRKIIESNDIDEEKIIQVRTTNTYDNLAEQTALIAEKIGTRDKQEAWQAEFGKIMEEILANANEKKVSEINILVHTHLAAFAESIGYNVLEIFGADELSPAKIGELAALNPDLIIDNYHNPQGEVIKELCDTELVVLRNFPGPEHKDLMELFKDNVKKLGL